MSPVEASSSDVVEADTIQNVQDLTLMPTTVGDGVTLFGDASNTNAEISSGVWNNLMTSGATEIYFMTLADYNSAPGTEQSLSTSTCFRWGAENEGSARSRTQTDKTPVSHPGSIGSGVCQFKFDGSGYFLRVKISGTKYYIGPKRAITFNASTWWEAYSGGSAGFSLTNSMGIQTVNSVSFSSVGASSSLKMPSGSSFTALSNVKKIELKNLECRGADMSGTFQNLANLESVVLGSNFANNITNTSSMFAGCTHLNSITFQNSNFGSAVTNASSMFSGCSRLASITLNAGLFTNPTNLSNMFDGCSQLTTINVGSNIRQVRTGATTTNMFNGCTNLKGGAGYKYNPSYKNGDFARVDYGGILPGYLTCTNNSIYNSAVINIDKNWFDNSSIAKSNITKIKFYNTNAMETVSNDFEMNTTNHTHGYIDGNVVKIHIAHQINKIRMDADMSSFFKDFTNVTEIEGLDLFNVTAVTNMQSAFENCSALTTLTLPTDFNTSAVTDMSNMISSCSSITSLTLPANFNTSAVTNMSNMFGGCSALTSLTLPNNFNTSVVTNISNMFAGCSSLANITGGNILINVATDTSNMFNNCQSLTSIDLKGSTFANVSDSTNMFNGCTNLTEVKVNSNIRNLPAGATTTDMFEGCTNLKGGAGYPYNSSHTDGEFARVDYGGIKPGYFTCTNDAVYNSVVINIDKDWFNNASIAKSNITKIKFYNSNTVDTITNDFLIDATDGTYGYIDANEVKIHIAHQINTMNVASDMSNIFKDFTNATEITGLDMLNTSAVTNMTSAFENCSALTSLTLPTNFNTSAVTNMSNMFGGCSSLTSLTLPANFNTNAVTNMSNMFGGCSSLTSLTLPTNFNLAAVTDMSNMFSGCSHITNISGGNILLNAVTNTSNMFNNCHSLTGIDLKGSTFANLNNATNMFNACSNLKDIKVDTNLRNLPAGATTTDMFAGCTNLKGGGGFKYDANHKNGEYARVDYGGILPGYFTCSDDSIYNTISFDVNKTWVDNVVKASIFKIVFSTASTIENYESEFDLKTLDTSIDTKGYLKDGGTTLVVHIAPQIGELIADTNWSEFFANFTNLLMIENFKVIDTTNVVNASKAFYNCERIVTIDMTDINIENIQNLESAFEGCRNLIGYSGKIATFSSLVNAKRTFKDCESLQIISFDICDTPTLTTTEEMFMGCTNLARIVISDNYQGIQGASYTDMFKDCVSLVGGQGFGYNPTDPNAGSGEFARIDYGGIMPGYYTLLNPSLYDNVTFNVPTDWFHSTTKNKSDITEIKFYNDAPTLGGGSAIGSYDEMFYIDNVNKTRAYIDGNTVKFHYGYSINQLKLGGDISGLFKDFTNLTTVTGLDNKVDFTSVTNMSELFSDCDNIRNISFNPNTENVTNMEKVFYDCDNLESVTIGSNLKLNKVTNLESAFEGCKKLSALNIGIASFSSVENLKNAFKDCESLTVFSFDICDTPTLATTSGMFSGCKNLRKIYVNDNFQGLQHIAYDNMFDGCINLIGGEGFTYSPTVPECKSGEFARVDYGGIMPGYYTIINTAKYNDVVFDLETDWYKSATLPKEEVKKIKFFNTSQSEGGMGAYDEMFYMSDTDKTRVYVETSTKTIKFHYGHDINSLKFQGDVEGMFADFVNLESIEGIEKLDASRIVNMSQMFAGCKNMKAVVVPTGLINATTLSEAFKDCTSLETVVFGEGAKVENFTALDGMFENCTSLKTIDFGTSFDISKVTNMERMFKNCESLTEIKLNQTMSTGNIESMREMFMGCTSLTSESLVMPLASLDISNVKDMGYMFASCSNLTVVDLSGIEANKLNTMEYMFAGCENLSSISFGGNFNTSNVVNMSHMFDGCTNLKGMAPNQNTNRAQSNNFLSNLLRLNDKKYGAGETNNNSKILDLSGLKTDNVVDMQGMFANCNGVEIINLSNINTENVEDMSYMFASCSELRFIVAKDFATSSVIHSENMFMNCPKLMGCEGTKWIDTQVLDDEYAVVDMGPNSEKKGYLTWGNAHIRYSAGKGVYGTMDEDVVVRFSSYKLKKNEFIRKGYIFAGWEDEDGNSYKNESQIVVMNNLNLTPVWRLSSSGDDDSKPGDNGGGGNGGNGGGSSSGPGGGGGGGGNGRGGTLARIGGGGTANIDFIVHTPITMAEHRWTYDDKGERLGVEIRKDSNLGKALTNSQNHVSRWQVSTDEDYIKLKNGLYSIEYAGVSFYFGIDDNCKMITGFIQTSENTENRYIDINSGQFTESFTTQSAKYLLYNGDGIYRGILWTVPITINNILYTFDEQGRVIKEENMTATNNALAQENDVSKWEYDPAVNKWKYYFVDENGKGDYYKDGVYSIEYLGNTLYYSFDSNGYMNTGLKEINGNTYYLQETGNFAGSIFVGSISLNGKDYEFDEQGRMVSAMTKTEQ